MRAVDFMVAEGVRRHGASLSSWAGRVRAARGIEEKLLIAMQTPAAPSTIRFASALWSSDERRAQRMIDLDLALAVLAAPSISPRTAQMIRRMAPWAYETERALKKRQEQESAIPA